MLRGPVASAGVGPAAKGTQEVPEGNWGTLEPEVQTHPGEGQHCSQEREKRRGEVRTDLLFVYSKEGLHWCVGAVGKEKEHFRDATALQH